MTLDELQVLAFGVALADGELRKRVLAVPFVGLHPNQRRWLAAMRDGRESAIATILGVKAGELPEGKSIAEWIVDTLEMYCERAERDHVEKVMNRDLPIGDRGRASLRLGER